MASENEGARDTLPNSGRLLEPLPSLTSIPNVKEEKLDAGLRSLDHYRTRLPLWRYLPRQWVLPLLRKETPYLAALQDYVRTPALDTYFSITANLGTHTFFMTCLPMIFWCGYTELARAMVHMLGTGVFFTGVLKDLCCLPRPLSPPMKRISMSKSAPLEYGFPSTHATNAVSVVVYTLFALNNPELSISPTSKLILEIVCYWYAISIMLGRLYCGMHGFTDVIVGSLMGAVLGFLQCFCGPEFDRLMHEPQVQTPFVLILIVLVLIRIHPEPADDCPCFDDSVAFGGTLIGTEVGSWHFAQSGFAWDSPTSATVPFSLDALGWPRTIARILVGVATIFAWRAIMKPTMLRLLPPIFRIVERLGLSLPRKFFVKASEYNQVPDQIDDDNVIPPVSQLPSMLTKMRHPRKNRSVSVGPQSEADAYETLAYREESRRENTRGKAAASSSFEKKGEDTSIYFNINDSTSTSKRPTAGMLLTTASSSVDLNGSLTEGEAALYTPSTPGSGDGSDMISRRPSQERRQDEREEREMFSKLEKPRVRYDVEVITKLIVYTGIGWIAVEGAPLLFHFIGLGVYSPPI